MRNTFLGKQELLFVASGNSGTINSKLWILLNHGQQCGTELETLREFGNHGSLLDSFSKYTRSPDGNGNSCTT